VRELRKEKSSSYEMTLVLDPDLLLDQLNEKLTFVGNLTTLELHPEGGEALVMNMTDMTDMTARHEDLHMMTTSMSAKDENGMSIKVQDPEQTVDIARDT